MVTIREAISDDAPVIADIRQGTIRKVVAPLGLYTPQQIEEWSSNYDASRVRKFIADGNFLVAESDGRVVAYGRLMVGPPAMRGRVGTVRGVFVEKDNIGRGIGGQVLDRLLELGARIGVEVFELVATLNAQHFYERHGFRALERVMHATPNGTAIPGVVMRNDRVTPNTPA